MLKKRVIPSLLLSEGRMIKGKQFKDFRETGNPNTTLRTFSAQDADEICFINIDQSPSSFSSLVRILSSASKECSLPLTAGGGITSLEDASQLFNAGADKVLVTSAAFRDRSLLRKISKVYGSQSIVAGIDYVQTQESPLLYIDNGNTMIDVSIDQYAQQLESDGAGEILLTCISRDGMMNGYDIDTCVQLCESVSIPIIVSGGAGTAEHIRDLFTATQASGACCGSLFHFGDNNPIRLRSYLRNHLIPMRRLR